MPTVEKIQILIYIYQNVIRCILVKLLANTMFRDELHIPVPPNT